MIYKLTIILIFIIATSNAFTQIIINKGYRLSDESITKDFTLMKITPSIQFIAGHIVQVNYKIEKDEALEIAQNILTVSACFNIDPWILTALIQKESSFQKTAVSPTNAAGLTQFTSLGLKEVNDQLGLRGRTGATESAILYFSTQVKECIDPNWVDLWIKISLPEEDPTFYTLLKEEIKTNTTSAVVYGAILLKTFVAYIDNKNKNSEVKPLTSEIYYQALQAYNGEEGDTKVLYAKSVFKNLKAAYPNEVNFAFLAD